MKTSKSRQWPLTMSGDGTCPKCKGKEVLYHGQKGDSWVEVCTKCGYELKKHNPIRPEIKKESIKGD